MVWGQGIVCEDVENDRISQISVDHCILVFNKSVVSDVQRFLNRAIPVGCHLTAMVAIFALYVGWLSW